LRGFSLSKKTAYRQDCDMRTGWISAGLLALLLGAAIAAHAADSERLQQGRALLREAETEAAAGAAGAALAGFTRAIEMRVLPAAEQAHALLQRGLVLDSQQRLKDALGDYDAALRLQPRLAVALNNRANIYRRQGRYDEARRDYRAALTAGNPGPQYSWFGLGRIAEARHDSTAARAYYRRALAVDPGYAAAAARMAALGPEPPIKLRPPPARTAVALHPPAPRAHRAGIAPAAYRANLALRPALDGAPGRIQLGAWRTAEAAHRAWLRLSHLAADILSGLKPAIEEADLPGRGRYYRLRVNAEHPARLCAGLARKGLDCMPVRD
jgi:tetratricopeptide (TPR) repeat protein